MNNTCNHFVSQHFKCQISIFLFGHQKYQRNELYIRRSGWIMQCMARFSYLLPKRHCISFRSELSVTNLDHWGRLSILLVYFQRQPASTKMLRWPANLKMHWYRLYSSHAVNFYMVDVTAVAAFVIWEHNSIRMMWAQLDHKLLLQRG